MTVIPGFGQIAQQGLARIGERLQQFAAQKLAIDAQKRKTAIEDKQIKEMEKAIDTLGPLIGQLLSPQSPANRTPQPTGQAGALGLQRVSPPVAPEVSTQGDIGEAALRTGVDVATLARQQALQRLPPEIRNRVLAGLSELPPEAMIQLSTDADLIRIEAQHQNAVSRILTTESVRIASAAGVPVEVAKGVLDGSIPMDDPRAQPIVSNKILATTTIELQNQLTKAQTALALANAERARREALAGTRRITSNAIFGSQQDQIALGAAPELAFKYGGAEAQQRFIDSSDPADIPPEQFAYLAELQRVTSTRERGALVAKQLDDINSAINSVGDDVRTSQALTDREEKEAKEAGMESAANSWNASVGAPLNTHFAGRAPPIQAVAGKDNLEFVVTGVDEAGNPSQQEATPADVQTRIQQMTNEATVALTTRFNPANVIQEPGTVPPVPDVGVTLPPGVTSAQVAGIAARAIEDNSTADEIVASLQLGEQFSLEQIATITAAVKQSMTGTSGGTGEQETSLSSRATALAESTPEFLTAEAKVAEFEAKVAALPELPSASSNAARRADRNVRSGLAGARRDLVAIRKAQIAKATRELIQQRNR